MRLYNVDCMKKPWSIRVVVFVNYFFAFLASLGSLILFLMLARHWKGGAGAFFLLAVALCATLAYLYAHFARQLARGKWHAGDGYWVIAVVAGVPRFLASLMQPDLGLLGGIVFGGGIAAFHLCLWGLLYLPEATRYFSWQEDQMWESFGVRSSSSAVSN